MQKTHGMQWVAGEATPSKTYITRIFNFGTWEEWQLIKTRYGVGALEAAVKNPLRGMWTRQGKAFAETLFDCTLPPEALLSYDA